MTELLSEDSTRFSASEELNMRNYFEETYGLVWKDTWKFEKILFTIIFPSIERR